jgi:hypothetical protein
MLEQQRPSLAHRPFITYLTQLSFLVDSLQPFLIEEEKFLEKLVDCCMQLESMSHLRALVPPPQRSAAEWRCPVPHCPHEGAFSLSAAGECSAHLECHEVGIGPHEVELFLQFDFQIWMERVICSES